MAKKAKSQTGQARRIWIDLDNSPHVPFFVPIIEELRKRGYVVLVTVRDCFQVSALADLHGLEYRRIGRHYGKVKILKVAGLCIRALQLASAMLKEKPVVAISHGSRAQLLVAALARIPSIVIMDYEFARGLLLMEPGWVMVPDVISDDLIRFDPRRILRYPGIKEDVYTPTFNPDPSIRPSLGLNGKHVVVTVRPPANEAHYYNPRSEELFTAAMDFLATNVDAKVVLLPRNRSQETALCRSYSQLLASGKLVIPNHAVDGLNLIWYSDLVISGGGTMNREAAALGVPVYSVFGGKIGAVDRYLVNTGRLVVLESTEDVRTKIALNRRVRLERPEQGNTAALGSIVDQVAEVVERSSR